MEKRFDSDNAKCHSPRMELKDLEPLLRAREVAQLLRVSVRTVVRMADRGDLTRVRIGRRTVLFRRDEVLALLDRAAKCVS